MTTSTILDLCNMGTARLSISRAKRSRVLVWSCRGRATRRREWLSYTGPLTLSRTCAESCRHVDKVLSSVRRPDPPSRTEAHFRKSVVVLALSVAVAIHERCQGDCHVGWWRSRAMCCTRFFVFRAAAAFGSPPRITWVGTCLSFAGPNPDRPRFSEIDISSLETRRKRTTTANPACLT